MMDSKVNILMVDDQPAKLLTYEAILGELGENLVKAASGREALELLLKMDFAVILMDVSMPELDGFQLAEMIRQHPRFQKLAIIFISGVHLTDLDRLKGYQRGAMDYISVPVVPEVLRAKVSVFAALYRQARELELLNHELEQRVLNRTEQLRESESQFRTLANSIPQLAWMANPDGSVSWSNQRWHDYTGAVLEQMHGTEWRRLHHPEHVGRVVESIQRSWETGEPWEETAPLLGRDGQYRWFLSRAIPIRDSHDKVVRWFGTSTDISRQIAAEQQIRSLNTELELRVTELETIMQVLPIGVSVAYDPRCHVVAGNAAFNQMVGMETGSNSADGNGAHRSPRDIFQNGRRLAPEELPINRAAAAGKPVHGVELELRDQSGGAIQALISASPLFNGSGKVRGAVGTMVDITERKRMEQELRQRADLLDLASEAIMVRGLDGVLQFWNSGAEAFYGWDRTEVLGRNVHQVLHTKFPVSAENPETVIERSGRWEGNLVQMTKAGREVVVASRQVLQTDSGGTRHAILEISRDITAQLQAEEALRKAEKLAAMGRVAGIIAHEINNPLDTIRNVFYLLCHHPSLDENAREYTRIAEEELARVAHITRQTLSFYRESKEAVPVSIAEILDDILALQSRLLQRTGIALEKEYSSDGPLQGFPGELKQVFLNLIGNAIQAMPDGGRLRIRVRETMEVSRAREGVQVLISDTGSGIRPEDAKQLFEPFFTTKSTKGTGLGLWISKGIVQKYEGRIRFRSMRLPQGQITAFSVFIPRSASSKASESGEVSSAP